VVLPLEVDDPPSALHFDTYVHARSGALLRLAFLLTGDAHHAEDLVQTTLVKVMGRWEQVTAGGDPHAYVRKVLLHERLRRALLQLPARQRAAVVLRHYEDLSEQDVARELGCSVGTVKSQTARGLDRLRSLMSDEP